MSIPDKHTILISFKTSDSIFSRTQTQKIWKRQINYFFKLLPNKVVITFYGGDDDDIL